MISKKRYESEKTVADILRARIDVKSRYAAVPKEKIEA